MKTSVQTICERNTVRIDKRENIQTNFIDTLSFFFFIKVHKNENVFLKWEMFTLFYNSELTWNILHFQCYHPAYSTADAKQITVYFLFWVVY